MFGSLLFGVSTLNPFEWPVAYFCHLSRLFIFSQCLFSFGYIFGEILSFHRLRVLAVPGALACHAVLLLALCDVNVIKHVAQTMTMELPIEL